MYSDLQSNQPREGMIPVENAKLYYREVGGGQPVIVLHGGPDFDHTYLLPELDRLSDSFRLIYYDQRGRGRSTGGMQPEDVTVESETNDIESLREYFHLEAVALLGHSWGGLLALEYGLRHPERVSHLILMNTPPASADDYWLFQHHRHQTAAADMEKLEARSTDIRYQEGDPDTVARYYRIHFRVARRQPEHLDLIVDRLRSSFTKEGILKARAIEERLMNETWLSSEYNLFPSLTKLHIPTLILHGDHDLIPLECAVHVAQAIPGSRFVLLKDCGHFSYLESPNAVRKEIKDFFQNAAL